MVIGTVVRMVGDHSTPDGLRVGDGYTIRSTTAGEVAAHNRPHGRSRR
ncbi:hypothetical protein [uncultured Streptomyces sp.]|nr:hypothetical protein [uncultured Streptomyces sp.]